jgi:diketogulonate reductase-like aldo/keto reductase
LRGPKPAAARYAAAPEQRQKEADVSAQERNQSLQFPGRIGLGTWKMGAARAAHTKEVAAVSHALAVGYRLFDTAEMYADGGAERILGSALQSFGRSRRNELFIVSKVLPENASHRGTLRACEASIARMGCEYLDMYLLHWRGAHAFRETLQAFAELRQRGLIRHYGVSNFDVTDLAQWRESEQALGLPAMQCNQVYYCLESRGIEFALLPWQRERGIQTMAYAPLGLGALARNSALARMGDERGISAAQIALAWAVRQPDVTAIPKSVEPQRIEQNLQAAQLRLSAAEIAQLDQLFAAPRSKHPLATT